MINQDITLTDACNKLVYELANAIFEEIEKYPDEVKPIAYNVLLEAIKKTQRKICAKLRKPITEKTIEKIFTYLRLDYVGRLYYALEENNIPITKVIDFISQELAILDLDLIIIPKYANTHPELSIIFLRERIELEELEVDIKKIIEKVIELSRNQREFVAFIYLIIVFIYYYGYIPDDILDNYGYYLLYLPSMDQNTILTLFPIARLIYVIYQVLFVLVCSLVGLYYYTNNNELVKYVSELGISYKDHIKSLITLREFNYIYEDELLDFLTYEENLRDLTKSIFTIPNIGKFIELKVKEFEEKVIEFIPKRFKKIYSSYLFNLTILAHICYNSLELITNTHSILYKEYKESAKRLKIREIKYVKRFRRIGRYKRIRTIVTVKRPPAELPIFLNVIHIVSNVSFLTPKLLEKLLL